MSSVIVQKVPNQSETSLPIFEEMGRLLTQAKNRAYELFENRGREIGKAIDDWVTAEKETFGCPASELVDKGKQFEMRITLPGFEAREVQVTATPLEVLVHASTARESRPDSEKVLWSEFGKKDVYRRFELPEAIDVEQVTARLDKGLLQVTAEKAAAPKKKEIAIATVA